jgi:hypothetical protein
MTDDTAAVAEPTAPVEPAEPAVEAPAEPETITLPRAEADALRRRVAEAEKAQRKIEAERKKADEERQAEEGKWKELAEQRDRELAQERAERTRMTREQRITRLAAKAKFLDPADVVGRVSAEDGEDDALTENALAQIAERSPHLIAKEQPAPPQIGQVLEPGVTTPGTPGGKPAPPPGKAPLQSLDEANSLPQAEVVARMDEVEWLERQEQGRK